MRRSSKKKALSLCVLLIASVCSGRSEAHLFPDLREKISPLTSLFRAADRNFGLYLTHPELREESEGVYQTGSTLKLTYLDDFEARRIIGPRVCAFARWLLLGRLEKSEGAQLFFIQSPEIQEVELMIYRLRSILSLGATGTLPATKASDRTPLDASESETKSTPPSRGAKRDAHGASRSPSGRVAP